MIHKMKTPIEFFRAHIVTGDRNSVQTENISIGIKKCNIREVKSEYTANSTEPVAWKYMVTLSVKRNEDIRLDDTFILPDYGHFHVVETKKAQTHRQILGLQMKNGDETI